MPDHTAPATGPLPFTEWLKTNVDRLTDQFAELPEGRADWDAWIRLQYAAECWALPGSTA